MHLKSDHDNSIAAIRAFRPVKYLSLHSLRSIQNLHQMIEQHSPPLEGLIMGSSGLAHSQYPRLDVSGIFQLVTQCPNLEELHLQIKRTMDIQVEYETYKALGEFSNLHSLMLDLHFDARLKLAQQRERSPKNRVFYLTTLRGHSWSYDITSNIPVHQVRRRLGRGCGRYNKRNENRYLILKKTRSSISLKDLHCFSIIFGHKSLREVTSDLVGLSFPLEAGTT
ncbi:hypothetical protein N7448_005767 [Penicillium atrosanguineum]|uniref:Uncharacterized protein n=1 Tax=Penicillium atrosanguineum TaxID=1132637 RepID=A0A9W9PSA1_9EURO|nr:uncharacterized protein N7443_009530 [Penicillium atrosanguineum]KAJ5131609.1 hypothetical protein N7448_005767 [Penicillium atrosanguineum]KAJ5138186.1 hypothetical protein N7526_004419 [Penicillium atrosanguineum]KAJ5289277.1 hypothetical protein N7443_009530 [Penicillium atrosanguineum]KAJ5307090.1 hypothetical protein N7476_007746 [Penicillium atrosanguineum]